MNCSWAQFSSLFSLCKYSHFKPPALYSISTTRQERSLLLSFTLYKTCHYHFTGTLEANHLNALSYNVRYRGRTISTVQCRFLAQTQREAISGFSTISAPACRITMSLSFLPRALTEARTPNKKSLGDTETTLKTKSWNQPQQQANSKEKKCRSRLCM